MKLGSRTAALTAAVNLSCASLVSWKPTLVGAVDQKFTRLDK